MGLVSQVFTEDELAQLPGHIGIGPHQVFHHRLKPPNQCSTHTG
jgi:glutamine phosphoribosylpyrophosphate amidotransferase